MEKKSLNLGQIAFLSFGALSLVAGIIGIFKGKFRNFSDLIISVVFACIALVFCAFASNDKIKLSKKSIENTADSFKNIVSSIDLLDFLGKFNSVLIITGLVVRLLIAIDLKILISSRILYNVLSPIATMFVIVGLFLSFADKKWDLFTMTFAALTAISLIDFVLYIVKGSFAFYSTAAASFIFIGFFTWIFYSTLLASEKLKNMMPIQQNVNQPPMNQPPIQNNFQQPVNQQTNSQQEYNEGIQQKAATNNNDTGNNV